MKKRKINIFTLIACVLSYLSVLVAVLGLVFIAFDIMGISTIYEKLLMDMGYGLDEISSEKTMLYIEMILVALVNLYFANFYLKGIKYNFNTEQYGQALITKGLFQMILASAVAGIFGVIAGMTTKNNVGAKVKETKEPKAPFVSDYKFQAMSEAVTRLKELKEKGAISEEEYYETLNKILEG